MLIAFAATKAFYEFSQASQGWTDADVQARILDVYDTQTLRNYVHYDHYSVMKYVSSSNVCYHHLILVTGTLCPTR